MRRARVGFQLFLGLAFVAACSGVNPNDLLAVESSATPIACGASSCAGSSPFCCESDVSLDGAKSTGPSDTCVATPSSCVSPTAIRQCESATNCGGGQVCCRLSSGVVTSQLCELTCAIGESQLCASASDCVAGEQCQLGGETAADGGATDIGECVPGDSGVQDARPTGDHG
ncbi:MAG: hypothetical protein WBY94_16380 [Polyangiaceae bacterium]